MINIKRKSTMFDEHKEKKSRQDSDTITKHEKSTFCVHVGFISYILLLLVLFNGQTGLMMQEHLNEETCCTICMCYSYEIR